MEFESNFNLNTIFSNNNFIKNYFFSKIKNEQFLRRIIRIDRLEDTLNICLFFSKKKKNETES